jgi:hypothetical protein
MGAGRGLFGLYKPADLEIWAEHSHYTLRHVCFACFFFFGPCLRLAFLTFMHYFFLVSWGLGETISIVGTHVLG